MSIASSLQSAQTAMQLPEGSGEVRLVAGSSANLDSDSVRLSHQTGALSKYLCDGESIVGYGYGGSESLTLFVRSPTHGNIVRKILSDPLITAKWDKNGRDVMLPPHIKARRQAEWLRNVPSEVSDLFPRILEPRPYRNDCSDSRTHDEFIYDMTYVPGIEVSRFIRDHQPAPAVVALLYSEIFHLLSRKIHRWRHRVPRGDTLEASYFGKIEKRLRLSQATAPTTFSAKLLTPYWITINGQRLRNVPELLRVFRTDRHFRSVLEPRYHSLVVGDTNTENIKLGNIAPLLTAGEHVDFETPPFTAEDLDIRFLDPRSIGYHEEGADTGADDPMYDNKPWHNSLGNYDMIHGEYFDMEFTDSHSRPRLEINFHPHNPYSRSYEGISRYFLPAMTRAWHLNEPTSSIWRNDPYWIIRFVFLMGTHFMAMPPFHFSRTADGTLKDTPEAQKRPLAIYAEGIKWLNLAADMLEGRETDFLGVPVPDIRRPVAYPTHLAAHNPRIAAWVNV